MPDTTNTDDPTEKVDGKLEAADAKVDAAADKLQDVADQAAAKGGLPGKAADELAGDAAFVRQLKPSLMKARAQGDAPTDAKPGEGRVAPSGPQLRAQSSGRSGPNPLVVIGIAFFLGILLAKIVDWRGHAHPR